MQQHYKGYCITQQHNGTFKIEGYTNVFYSQQEAKDLIDILDKGITKANGNCIAFATQKN